MLGLTNQISVVPKAEGEAEAEAGAEAEADPVLPPRLLHRDQIGRHHLVKQVLHLQARKMLQHADFILRARASVERIVITFTKKYARAMPKELVSLARTATFSIRGKEVLQLLPEEILSLRVKNISRLPKMRRPRKLRKRSKEQKPRPKGSNFWHSLWLLLWSLEPCQGQQM